MSIKFKVIEKGEPGVIGGGAKKFYASANMSGEKTLWELTRYIEKKRGVSGTDIRAVLDALTDVITASLADGEAVRLGELGSLRINISSEGKATAEEVTAESIRTAKVIFAPGTAMREMLATVTYEKMIGDSCADRRYVR